MSEKKPLTSLFCDNPRTPEGKYCVLRRDGSRPEAPSFVILAADPNAGTMMRVYALLASGCRPDLFAQVVRELLDAAGGATPEYVNSVLHFAGRMDRWREENGDGDPFMGPHRKDDPKILELMRQGGQCA
jgi:hypothetical protein